MKKNMFKLASLMVLSALLAATPLSAKEIKVGIVNFKECVEGSKLGKQEQDSFDALKKQMETVLEEKEKQLNDLAQKIK